MDRITLERRVKPWWLSPPVFSMVMILVGAFALGTLGLEWYIDRQMKAILGSLGCLHVVQVLGVTAGESLGLLEAGPGSHPPSS